MRVLLAFMLFTAGIAANASAQKGSPDAHLPRFEVASVKPAAASGSQTLADLDRAFAGVGGRVDLLGVNLAYLILRVFNLRSDQLSGPTWLSSAFYDIAAVAPPGTAKEQIPLMLQDLLAERFQLKFHRESPMTSVYALICGPDGCKPRPGIPDDDPSNLGPIGPTSAAAGPGGAVTAKARASWGVYTLSAANGVTHYEFQNISMNDLVQFLSPKQGRGPIELPVIDGTGLTGRYQLSLDIATNEMHGVAARPPAEPGEGESAPGASDPPGFSIRASLEKQGLRLVRRSVPFEKFIIDHVEKSPTEN